MRIKRLVFPGSQGHQLGARLDLPDEDPLAYALFAHCFTCTKNLKAATHINRALTDQGIAVLRFDFTGLGESEGDFSDTNFSSNIVDLVAAARFLESQYEAPRILIGHSLGGAAVIHAAHLIPSCVAVVTIAAPSNLEHVGHLLLSKRAQIERDGEAEVVLAGQTFRIKKQFFDNLEQNNMQQAVSQLGRALLVLHSPSDAIVSVDNAHQIFAAARHPKSLIALDQADHLLMNAQDATYAGELTAVWARKYIEG